MNGFLEKQVKHSAGALNLKALAFVMLTLISFRKIGGIVVK
jgi:hypothetical protein